MFLLNAAFDETVPFISNTSHLELSQNKTTKKAVNSALNQKYLFTLKLNKQISL